jgi:uncharacterized protein YciI
MPLPDLVALLDVCRGRGSSDLHELAYQLAVHIQRIDARLDKLGDQQRLKTYGPKAARRKPKARAK